MFFITQLVKYMGCKITKHNVNLLYTEIGITTCLDYECIGCIGNDIAAPYYSKCKFGTEIVRECYCIDKKIKYIICKICKKKYNIYDCNCIKLFTENLESSKHKTISYWEMA